MSISSLEAMVAPFGYESNLKGQNPKKMSMGQSLTLLRDTMEEIYEFLFEKDLFYASYSEEELGVKNKEGENNSETD